MSEGEAEEVREPEEVTVAPKVPGLFRNYISFAGAAIAAAGFVSIALMILLELTGSEDHNPYLGIFTYIIFPAVMGFGLLLIPVGMLWERRRRRRLLPEEIVAFPILDLNNPQRRRSFVTFLVLMFIFLFMSAFGSYRAFEHTESVQFCGQTCHTVMKPEFVAYQASPHARVKCVECHVGPGADWYVRSKISGAYQLYAVAFKKYPKPITTPVHNLRPAQDTCEKCHWPEKFFGAQLKVFNRFGYDEANTHSQTRMLINVGGGNPAAGQVAGIHWHMNIANEISYIPADEQRQVIPFVRMKDPAGRVTDYFADGVSMTPEEIARAPQRRMDCVDCHNRPSHIYVPPDRAVNDAFVAGRLDPSLPYLKRQAVQTLTKSYQTTDEALQTIASDIEGFYRTSYPEVAARQGESIGRAVAELQRIFQTFIFPEMKVDWKTHPDNIGHYYFQGCFRCHDGQHASRTGHIIRNDCNVCHTVLDQMQAGTHVAVENGAYRHPVDLGGQARYNCTHCHTGDKAFQHPVNLGDITGFRCSECHK
jgi:hypothetical protein